MSPQDSARERDPERSRLVAGMRVDGTSYDEACDIVVDWAGRKGPRYVCVCSVHMVIEGDQNPDFRSIVNQADLVTPDGVPLVWSLRALGVNGAQRVYGPELTPRLCARAAREGIPVGFYGGTEDVMAEMLIELERRAPGLNVAYSWCPPFRELTEEEDAEVVRAIRDSGARIVFVGIGCPRQERWMHGHRDDVDAVMLGVGAAFDFLAGRKRQAPRILQDLGLEWFFRLVTEPRRLWRRYLLQTPRFLPMIGRQLWQQRGRRKDQIQS